MAIAALGILNFVAKTLRRLTFATRASSSKMATADCSKTGYHSMARQLLRSSKRVALRQLLLIEAY